MVGFLFIENNLQIFVINDKLKKRPTPCPLPKLVKVGVSIDP
jgi:hypothetical protein